MVAFTGFTVQEGGFIPSTSNRIADDLDELSQWAWPPLPADYSARVIDTTAFTKVNNLLVAQEALRSETGTGVAEASSFDVYYNTIHLLPSEVVLGNLLSNQDRVFEVWNAYLTPQTLSSITATGDSGLALSEPAIAPTDFSALESRDYTLSISASGPAVINASYAFGFPADTPVLSVSGNRLIPFVFEPNWRSPLIQRIEWKTDVLASDDRTEQRVKQRQAPRVSYEYLTTQIGIDAQRMKAMLWDWQARVFAMPLWQDEEILQTPVSIGDLLVTVNTSGKGFENGGLLIILVDSNTFETLEITTFTATTVSLARAAVSAWAAGAKVYPLFISRMSQSVSVRNANEDIIEGVVSFLSDNVQDGVKTDFATTYRGVPVLDRAPNSVADISTTFQRDLETLDNMTGIVSYDDTSGFANVTQHYNWILNTRADINILREWLNIRYGRLVSFWSSTWTNDLTMSELIASSETVFKIIYIGYASFMSQDVGRRDIKIVLNDGTVFYRRITSSSGNGDGTESLTIDAALGQLVNPFDVHMISFMQIFRLDSDAIEIAWRQKELAECSHLVRGLNYDV